ncbi:ribonuclease P protein component [Halobacteriovorax sp. HLS]|uniref:ribonuclease P protein component n=1 Tax=Halobacteriovorax sp. HLS TaxID=2234000 RepID=UPI000FD6C903|nr:ribonuclease P protein component [Halobacteriovorax sp. HLS]
MADNHFDKSYRLLSAQDFSYLRRGSKQIKTKWIMAYYRPSRLKAKSNHTRIGYSITKKVGKAHTRNRFKRIMRDMFRTSDCKHKAIDIIVIVSPFLTKKIESQEKQEKLLRESFEQLLLSI